MSKQRKQKKKQTIIAYEKSSIAVPVDFNYIQNTLNINKGNNDKFGVAKFFKSTIII